MSSHVSAWSMKPTIETYILDYLQFGEQGSAETRWLSAHDAVWKRGLEFADQAGLSLHLRDLLIRRDDVGKLPASIRVELERRHSDNVRRMRVMEQEFVEWNRQLQSADIRYLNLKGLLLAPDFVEPLERRAQYDYDFLVKKEDLQRALLSVLATRLLSPALNSGTGGRSSADADPEIRLEMERQLLRSGHSPWSRTSLSTVGLRF